MLFFTHTFDDYSLQRFLWFHETQLNCCWFLEQRKSRMVQWIFPFVLHCEILLLFTTLLSTTFPVFMQGI